MNTFQKIFHTLSSRERFAVNILILVVSVSLAASVLGFYYHFTKPVPVPGGEYKEGIVGQPMYINPVLLSANGADSSLAKLVFSSLFKYDADGKIVPDLAESVETSGDGLTYTVKIKQGVKWHDEEPFSVDDILFTYQLIQDPATKSPLRQKWQGIGMEVVDESTIKFTLPSPYALFVSNNLTTGILPMHVWETVAPGNFSLAEYNLRPVGTGPFRFDDFEKDSGGMILSYDLSRNENYFGEKPFLDKFHLEFYPDEETMIDAFNNKQIFGMETISPENLEKLKSKRSVNVQSIAIPRYFAVFFNQQKSKIMADREVRKALSLATDKKAIVNDVLLGRGRETSSPILPQMAGFADDTKKFEYDPEKAGKVLDDDGWKKDGDARKKDGNVLEINLVTTDWPPLQKTADILKSQWEKIGVKVNVESFGVGEIQQNYIRPREYEAILFGQSWTGFEADPFSLWHSSQSRDPGLNLALYVNSDSDKAIERLQGEADAEKRNEDYKKFQQAVADDVPAVFLYSPDHIYVTNKNLQGNQISAIAFFEERFAGATKWYMKTKRVKK
jgi:peptide/nickel transport system substrate-binding protein